MAAHIRITQAEAVALLEAVAAGRIRLSGISEEALLEAVATGRIQLSSIAIEALVEEPPLASFTATASPQAGFTPTLGLGSFIASASPQALFIWGEVIFTARPTATFEGINTAYTEMPFVSTAGPLATFGIVQLPGFLATAAPQFRLFPGVGQSERCVSGTGAPAQSGMSPRNVVY